jgi:hypothetical protein
VSSEFGIVMFDLSGGDFAVHFVNRERWEQIRETHAAIDESESRWENRFNEIVGWLTCDDETEINAPTDAPVRRGSLLKTIYTQTFVIESVNGGVEGRLLGVLTLP